MDPLSLENLLQCCSGSALYACACGLCDYYLLQATRRGRTSRVHEPHCDNPFVHNFRSYVSLIQISI